MKKLNKVGGRFTASFLILGFLYALYRGYQFRHHYALTIGTVTYITPPGYHSSGDYSIIFDYRVNGELYSGNNNLNYCHGQNIRQIEALLIGKQFPVVYWTKGPSGGFMLLTQDYADKFKYVLPDSAKVYDSVLTCR